MPEFTMSMFATKEDMYCAKAQYYERLATIALERLEEMEEVHKRDGEWINSHSGELVIDGL